ncbi:MAG: DUF1192 domain-containing protein [Alphaproteobacteria bacterium]|jgi:uncharacterized small protein (DUF1192 family)
MFEEDEPRPDLRYRIGENLESYSVVDLEELMQNLEAEIGRVKLEIDRKKGDLNAAESLFLNKT